MLMVPAIGATQDWDDFEPPNSDFGISPPPPPPPPIDPFIPPPRNDDFSPPPPPSSPPSFGGTVPGNLSQPPKARGPVAFNKTGEKKDLSKKNKRKEQLLSGQTN